MPFYEYQCRSCGHHLEVLQKISDGPLRKCPTCGRQTLQRLLSAPVFRLKGAGWYETDFKSEQESKRNLAEHGEKEPPAEKEKGAEAQSEAKEAPEAKAEPAQSKPVAEPGRPATAAARTVTKRPARTAKKPRAATRGKAARR